jgi:CAAX prenyl protease-like protein
MAARSPSWPYVAPFAIFLGFLALSPYSPGGPEINYPLRVVAVSAALVLWSRNFISLRCSRFGASVLLGLAVFVIWVGPDLLWPGYRAHWLFQNSLTGRLSSSIPEAARKNILFLVWRFAGMVFLVPVVEELFWRAWLMRYAIKQDFRSVALGAYNAWAFGICAVLFASEHGPYWDVGLVAGIAYNWWMVRTRSLGDCILAHAVTNASLFAYVLYSGQWEYLL